jgi:hypothetical protein
MMVMKVWDGLWAVRPTGRPGRGQFADSTAAMLSCVLWNNLESSYIVVGGPQTVSRPRYRLCPV